MAKVWKILALLLVITALVWLTTMWRWQSAQVDPSAADLALTLAVLPLVLTAALLMTLWAVKRLRSYAAAPPAAATPAAAPAQAAAAPTTAASERSAHVRVLASGVQVRSGTKWSDAQSTIASGECKPDLDAQIKGDDGSAVFTAPVADLSIAVLADALAKTVGTLAKANPEAWVDYEAPVEVLRALTLLETTVGSMHEALEAQWPALSAPPPPPRNKPTAPTPPPSVAIRVAIPARWSAQSQQAAGAWLEQFFNPFIDAGLQAAGQSRAMAHSVHPAVQLHVHPVASAEAFWLLMDQQLLQWQRDKEPGLLWALAADSLVNENDTTAMESLKELFSGSNQRGRVPGEAAAGLLLASPAWPEVPEAEPVQARLHRANLMRRDKSADASGRVSPQTLLQTATDALKASGWEPAHVTHMTTDADHRPSRTSEVFEMLQELLPQLDTSEQALRLGVGCGDLGVARLLTCVALTASQVQESQKPALVLGAFPAFERFAVVMTPPVAPPEATAAAPAPAA